MKRTTMVTVALATVVAFALPAGAGPLIDRQTPKQSTFYIAVAHPDDETTGWSYLEQLPRDTYTIFTLMTRGEATDSCLAPEEAKNQAGTDVLAPTDMGTFGRNLLGLPTSTAENSSGPYKYEGPDSPVGEPNKQERHPLGNPWVGQRTDACGDARIASWHWFLDEQFRIDGIGTDLAVVNDPEQDDDYKGQFCPPGHQGNGAGQPIEKQIGCAQVWANDLGARVVYDLGDQGYVDGDFLPTRFTPEHVTAAFQNTRASRADWGIPTLPEIGVLSPNVYGDGERCSRFAGSDHDVINEAIRYHDQGLPLRAGVMMCREDKLGDDTTVREIIQSPTSAVGWNLMNPATGDRIGPALVNYGWLIPDYVYPGCLDCFYWEVHN